MVEDIREVDKPFHVIGILDKIENFHSGHDTPEAAQSRCDEANRQAEKLKIKTRYITKENIKKEPSDVQEEPKS